MKNRSDLSELLRDEADIAELLQAYGEVPPANKKAARKRLLVLVEHLGEAALLTGMFEHARGFAVMAQEIFDFCSESSAAIAGQLQLAPDGVFIDQTALNSDWAFTGRASWTVRAEERAGALAAEAERLATRLAPENLVKVGTKTRDHELVTALVNSSDPKDQLMGELLRPHHQVRWNFKAFTEQDRAAVAQLEGTLATAQSVLAQVKLPPALISAFGELESRCQHLRVTMDESKLIRGRESSPVATVVDEVQILTTHARALGESVAEAQRAEGGFRDFLKSEFWFQRWRVYEVWLLVRLLRVLQDAGGEVHLQPIGGGVWKLPYSRGKSPVATCSFAERTLEVYYQLFEAKKKGPRGGKVADMPDFGVRAPGGKWLIILDPKHGRSYTRSEVQTVLGHYASHFNADLTAVFNYFEMKAYRFDEAHRFDDRGRQGRRWILASDVCPGGVGLRRLELNLTDVLLARGYGICPRPIEPPPVRAIRQPARAAYLVYWADRAVEVDEPGGFWIVRENSGPTPLADFAGARNGRFSAIHATPDGGARVLQWDARLVFIREKGKNLTLDELIGIGWNRQGTLFLAQSEHGVCVLGRNGKILREVEIPDGEPPAMSGWMADGESIAYQSTGSSPLRVFRSDDFVTWQLLFEGNTPPHSSLRESRFESLGSNGETLLFSATTAVIALCPTGGEVLPGGSNILSASHSGRYRVQSGPDSKRIGVNLLEIKDSHPNATPLPLLRFFGRLETKYSWRSVYPWRPDFGKYSGIMEWRPEIRWSPDETRFAFLARRRLCQGRIGDRHAAPVSLPGQEPTLFTWVAHALAGRFLAGT